MKKGSLFTILFMLVISAVFALLLSGANALYLPKIEANELLDERRAVLYVFELDTAGEADEVLARFDAAVEEQQIEGIDVLAHIEDGQVIAYAVPFSGSGLWGPMHGYLGISPDAAEITGLVFTEHSETPGLGGRVDEPVYLEQFRGVRIEDETTLAYGAAGGDQLDAITGATSTSNAVLSILNQVLTEKIIPLEVALNE